MASMKPLPTVAAVLLVLIWAGARAARGGWITRGELPHDPAYDDGPTLLDGWHGQEAP